MKRFLIALFALSSLFTQAQTVETVPNWTTKQWYFRPDAQNPKRIPKSYLTGNNARVVTGNYTTVGDADVAVGGGSTLTITLGQSTEAVQGKSILIYDYTGTRNSGNYIRVQSHSPSTVKIEGEDYYDINTVGGWVEVYFDGSNYKVRDSDRNLDGDVLLVQNGTIRAYKTIQLANAAAVAGGTIVLLKDLTLTAGLALTSGVSVDGNGKTITIGGSGDVDLFWVQSGISKIYNFKRIESTRTGSAARWLFACFGLGSKMYVDVDEIKVLDGCVALAGNDGSTLNINARKIDLGTYNAGGGLNSRKFFSNNGASIKVTGARITDSKVISTAYGFVCSVLYGGQELAEAGDTLRSVMELENVELDVSRPIAIVERMGELRLKNIKAKTLAKTAISVAGDPYTSNASLMRHYNKVILTDCEILGGTETQGVYFTSLISVTCDNSQGFDTNFQDIYCYGTNYVNTNTTNSFFNTAARYGIKNYGTIIYNGPIVGETFIYNQPIPLGATLVGGGSITSVGLSMPAAFNVAGSPITTSGTFAVTGAGTTAQYLRGDASLSTFATDVATTGNALWPQLAGSYANPAWITSLVWSKITSTPTTLSGYNITDGVSTGGSYANPSWITSLAASKISSILSIPQGGTGAATQSAALIALLPTQTGNSGKVLQTDGTNATWQTAGGGGGISGSGTTNKYLKWASSSSATDAIVSDDGSKVTVTGAADAMLVTSTGSGVTQELQQTSNNDILLRYKRNGGNYWDARYYYTGEDLKFNYNDATKYTLTTGGIGTYVGGLNVITSGVQSTSRSLFKINADGGFGATDLFQVFANGDLVFKNRFGANIFRYLEAENYINATSTGIRAINFTASGDIYSRLYGGYVYQNRTFNFDNSAGALLKSTTAADKILIVQGASSQSANLTEWQNSGGTALSYVNSIGALNIGATTASTSTGTGSATFGGGIGVSGTLSANIGKFFSESSNIVIYNTAGSQQCGRISRETSTAGLDITADIGLLQLATGSSASHIDLITNNANTDVRIRPNRYTIIGSSTAIGTQKFQTIGSGLFTGSLSVNGLTAGSSNDTTVVINAGVLKKVLNPAPIKVTKSANESVTSSATLQDDDHLSFAMAANTNYHITLKIFYTATASPAFKWGLVGGTSPTSVITEWQYRNGANGSTYRAFGKITTYPTSETLTGDDTDETAYLTIECNVQNVNAGTFKFQFAQATSHGESITVKKGSYLVYSTY